MKKYINILLAILFLFHSSCKSDKDNGIDPVDIGSELTIYFATKVPAMNNRTRAVYEDAVTSITVLVFENEGGGFQYIRRVEGYSLGATGDTEYNFTARIPYTTNPVKLFLLANYPNTGNITVGTDETTVREALTETFTAAGFDGTLPMFGEVVFPSLTSNITVEDVALVRSVARVDVAVSTADFTLTSVQLFRVSDRYQVIPNALVNNVATTASIPAGTTRNINTTQITVTNNESIEQLYLPESPLPAEADRQSATVVVVGGTFGDDTQPTFYRIDFVPSEAPALFGQVLRNHRYSITITDVLASGWNSPDEAANNQSSQITAQVKVWEENTIYMVFDNYYYLGVSSRIFNIPAPAGSQQSIEVDTNLDTYQLYWTDADGTIVTNIDPITWGGYFTNGDYTVSISPDGSGITATSSVTASQTTGYLLVVAGRLQIRLTILQGRLTLNNRSLNVYGSRDGIGSLGDFIFGGSDIGERSRGMVPLMRNSANFGFTGVVPIEQINIGGQGGFVMTEGLMNLFDVIYLTYGLNPGPVMTGYYLDWIQATDRRVLIVQYDDADANRTFLSTLGITRTTVSQTVPYTVFPNAPLEIMEGPFGAVDPAMGYRCFDTTHGEISLTDAETNGISPILMGNGGGVVLGIDFTNRIVYSGDIDLYNNQSNSQSGQYISNGGTVTNDAEKLIANLWAWIATTVLTE